MTDFHESSCSVHNMPAYPNGPCDCVASRAEYPKSNEDYFADWESHAFGFGYGSGEKHTIPAIKAFFELCPDGGAKAYDFRQLEDRLGATVAWLLINRFAQLGVLEYGSSPRFAWLTPHGKVLKAYIDDRSADYLVKLTERNEDYAHCYPDACNCGEKGYDSKRVCQNPFWVPQKRR